MIPQWLQDITAACPLSIERVEWHDPQLTIGGSDWFFNTVAPWRLLAADKMLTGIYDEGFQQAIRQIIGTTIVGCSTRASAPQIDPCFILSNGHQFEVFSTSALEPWTMSLPRSSILVASPTDPNWAL
jgi:hypothetical protein